MQVNKYNILLSVILPVYNGEKYINAAIKSVDLEKNPQCEIIIIDDGSVDATETIIQRWRSLKNIVYIKLKKNYGVSYARNVGIKYSNGKYITFLDCDDVFSKKAIRYYLKYICKYDADLIICGCLTIGKLNKKYNLKRNYWLNQEEFLKKMFFFDITKKVRYGVLWGKIYKRNLLLEKKIQFRKTGLIGEDTWFNIEYYGIIHTVLFIKNITYIHIDQNPNSLSKQYDKQYIRILCLTLKKYVTLFSSVGLRGINRFTLYKGIQLIWRTIIYYSR